MNSDKTRTVKLKGHVVDKVDANKKKTGVPIGIFIEQAIEEKLTKTKKQTLST